MRRLTSRVQQVGILTRELHPMDCVAPELWALSKSLPRPCGLDNRRELALPLQALGDVLCGCWWQRRLSKPMLAAALAAMKLLVRGVRWMVLAASSMMCVDILLNATLSALQRVQRRQS